MTCDYKEISYKYKRNNNCANNIVSSVLFLTQTSVTVQSKKWPLMGKKQSLFGHNAETAVTASVLWVSLCGPSRRSEELSVLWSTDSSAGSSGKAKYVGMALNMTKPTVMTTKEMMYRAENWGRDAGQNIIHMFKEIFFWNLF